VSVSGPRVRARHGAACDARPVSRAYPPEVPRVSRRTAIGIGGAAAAAAWAAPSVLAVDRVGAAGTGVAPVFRNVISLAGNSGAATLTLPIPADAFQAGDRLIAVGLIRWGTNPANRNAVVNGPSGWEPVPGPAYPVETVAAQGPPDVPGLRGYLFTTEFVAGTTQYVFTKTGSGNGTEWGIVILGFGGVDVSTPFDGVSSAAGRSTSVASPEITTTVANTRVLYVGGSYQTGTTWSLPTGYPVTGNPLAEAPPGTDNPEAYAASKEQVAAGVVPAATSTTVPGGLDDWVAFQLALRPA
jgi:hypothetical protein